jgi:RNA recognition motif-containing protein
MVDEKKMQHIDESDVKKYFDGYGTIESIDIPRDHVTLRPKGYILIEFARSGEAKDAVHLLDGFEIDGKKIKVDIFSEHL